MTWGWVQEGGRGQFLFERNPADISYKRSFDEKKGQILAT